MRKIFYLFMTIFCMYCNRQSPEILWEEAKLLRTENNMKETIIKLLTEFANEFGWDIDDKDDDGNLADPGEWGFVVYNYDDGSGSVIDTAFFKPWEVIQNEYGFPGYQASGV